MEERQRAATVPSGSWAICSTAIAGTENGGTSDLNPGGKEERGKASHAADHPVLPAAYRNLNATWKLLRPAENDNAEMDELLERIASLESELKARGGFPHGRAGGSCGEVLRAGGKVHGRSERRTAIGGTEGRANTVQKGKKNKAMPIRQVEHQAVSSPSQRL